MRLAFALDAATDKLVIPSPAPAEFKEGLWCHTCFEIFADDGGIAYREFNFSPSTEFAIYDFDGYRKNMTRVLSSEEPTIRTARDGLSIHVGVPQELLQLGRESVRRIGVAAVIEERGGTLSYWALRHPCEQPDFHHHGGFILSWPLQHGIQEHRT